LGFEAKLERKTMGFGVEPSFIDLHSSQDAGGAVINNEKRLRDEGRLESKEYGGMGGLVTCSLLCV
jgi:hypothetical protein